MSPNFKNALPPDPSEQRAQRTLARTADQKREAALHSVHDELNIFPADDEVPRLIDRDWSCARCGYNLYGLTIGAACPKCGHVNLERPSPTELPSYANWLLHRKSSTTATKSTLVFLFALLASGPWAIFGALISSAGPLAIIVFGPVAEEIMKVCVVAMLVEVRPYVFKSATQIVAAAIAGAFAFAAIENVMYLNVVQPMPMPSPMLSAWRWTICVGLHVGCTAIASLGVVKVWQRTMHELRQPQISLALPWLVLAMILHGSYNAIMTALSMTGFDF